MQTTNNLQNKSLLALIINSLVMALYVVLSLIVQPIAAGPVQFRISESLNHLVVFNRKFIWGVVGGVVLYNLFFGYGAVDAVFGGLQSLISLSLTAFLYDKVTNVKVRLALNTLFFSATMFIIAFVITMSGDEGGFWGIYFSLAVSEFAMMAVAAPIMYLLDKSLKFSERM